MDISNSFRGAAAELAGNSDKSDPAPRGTTASRNNAWFTSDQYQKYRPPKKEMQVYWAAYIEDSLVKNLINAYAREVVEPGWWVEADNDETAEKMAEWLRKAAILEGETNHDILLLIKKIVKQRFIRGTALVEHVPSQDDHEDFNSIQLLNPQTVTAFTRPETNILWPSDPSVNPDGDDQQVLSDRVAGRRRASYGQVPQKDNGDFCAYAQFYEDGFESPTALFTREEITKFPKDADVGDIYGNSPIESIIERLEAMRKKIKDRDKAIEQKAWPTWIFKMGVGDGGPWHPDDIDEFESNEDEESFTPGTKHFVQGDIEPEVIGGGNDVPDLEHPLKHDTNQIMDAMPAPKFISSHAEDLGKQLVIENKNRFGKRVKETRREIEYRFRRILLAKAEQEGWSTEGLTLRIAHPEGEDPDEYENRGTTIRYVSNAGNEGEPGSQRGEGNPEGTDSESSEGGEGTLSEDGSVDVPDGYETLTEAVDEELAQALAD